MAIKSGVCGVVGLEIHAQLATKSKLFSSAGCSFLAPVNSQVSHFDCALPGTLPFLNRDCVLLAAKASLALRCNIPLFRHLIAGYQITQYFKPLAENGSLCFYWQPNPMQASSLERCSVDIIKVQLEQDSGKSLHDASRNISLIDLNRAGIPLIEIVTAPQFHCGRQASAFVDELRLLLKTLETSSGDMSAGALRVDANISVHRPGEPLGVRVEVKNINSCNSLAAAVDFEISRQSEALLSGEEIVNETRTLQDTGNGIVTVSMRDKEKVLDYRFMPEPNLPPLRLFASHEDVSAALSTGRKFENKSPIVLSDIQASIPTTPMERRAILHDIHELSYAHATTILLTPGLYDLFIGTVKADPTCSAKLISHWIVTHYLGSCRAKELDPGKPAISPQQLAHFCNLISESTLTSQSAVQVLDRLLDDPSADASSIAKELDLLKISSETEIRGLILAYCSRPDIQQYVNKYRKYVTTTPNPKKAEKALNSLARSFTDEINHRCSFTSARRQLVELLSERN